MSTFSRTYAVIFCFSAVLFSFSAKSAKVDTDFFSPEPEPSDLFSVSPFDAELPPFSDKTLQQSEFEIVVNFLKDKKYDNAIEAAQKLIIKYPNQPFPQNLLAMAYMGKGDQEQARKLFEAVLQMAPGDPSAAGALAAIALKNKDDNGARAYYEQILNKHPAHVDTMIFLSRLENQTGHKEKAVQWLVKAGRQSYKQLPPTLKVAQEFLNLELPEQALLLLEDIDHSFADNPSLLIMKSLVLTKLKKPDAAEKTLLRLTELQPESAEAHFLLANVYGESNKIDKLKNELAETLRIDPNHLQAKILMGRVLMFEGKPEAANKLIAELKQAHPKKAAVFAQEGWQAERQNDFAGAVTAYQNAVEIEPNNRQLLSRLAIAQLRAKNGGASLDTLTGWLKTHPQDLAILTLRAQVNHLLGDTKAAIEDYKTIAELSPNNVLALNNLAWFLRHESPSQALVYSARAFELAADNPAVMDTRAMLLMDKGDVQQALNIIEKAAGKRPHDLSIQYHLALIYANSKRNKDAAAVLKTILTPNNKFNERAEAEELYKNLTH